MKPLRIIDVVKAVANTSVENGPDVGCRRGDTKANFGVLPIKTAITTVYPHKMYPVF